MGIQARIEHEGGAGEPVGSRANGLLVWLETPDRFADLPSMGNGREQRPRADEQLVSRSEPKELEIETSR